MKKILFPALYTSVLLWGASANATGLLKTVDVLCKPTESHVNIKDKNGHILFNHMTLQAVIDSQGGTAACINSGATNVYSFTAIDDDKKEVFNPLGSTEEKLVYYVSLNAVTGDAFRGNTQVLSGKIEPAPIDPPPAYQAIVETGQKIIPAPEVVAPLPTKETTYKHILK